MENIARRVLVVENHQETRELLYTLLTEVGHEVFATSDGREALLHMVFDRPDLVLTDLRMPLLDGNGLVAAIRADPALQSIAVVAITAHPQLASWQFDALIQKPFDVEELLAAIECTHRETASGGQTEVSVHAW